MLRQLRAVGGCAYVLHGGLWLRLLRTQGGQRRLCLPVGAALCLGCQLSRFRTLQLGALASPRPTLGTIATKLAFLSSAALLSTFSPGFPCLQAHPGGDAHCGPAAAPRGRRWG